jgi:hypothetical protein
MRNQIIFSAILSTLALAGCDETLEATSLSHVADTESTSVDMTLGLTPFTGYLEPEDNSDADPNHPFGRGTVTTEDFNRVEACYAERASEKADFFNSGTPCIDGMVALISGRGCEEVVYNSNEDGTYSVYCTEEPTCDNVHRDGYLAIPNNLDWTTFGNQSSLMCQDNNVTLIYYANKDWVRNGDH